MLELVLVAKKVESSSSGDRATVEGLSEATVTSYEKTYKTLTKRVTRMQRTANPSADDLRHFQQE